MRKNKYHAVRTNCGLHSHASKGESECCSLFQLLEKDGELEIIKSQPNVRIAGIDCRIIPDWLVRYKDGEEVYVDYKGFENASWRRNRRIWKDYGPLPLQVWKRRGNRFFCAETITPELKTKMKFNPDDYCKKIAEHYAKSMGVENTHTIHGYLFYAFYGAKSDKENHRAALKKKCLEDISTEQLLKTLREYLNKEHASQKKKDQLC